MESKKNKKAEAEKEQNQKKKKTKGTSFDYPELGAVVPDDVKLKKNKDGTYSYYYPDGKKWKY